MVTTGIGRAFREGVQFYDEEHRVHYLAHVERIGELDLRSGRVCVADSADLGQAVTLPIAAPAGRWPAELCAMSPLVDPNGSQWFGNPPQQLDSDRPARVIGARVRFADANAVEWEMAVVDDTGQPVGPYPQYPRISPGALDIKGPVVVVFDPTVEVGGLLDPKAASLADVPAGLVGAPGGANALVLHPNEDDVVYPWWGRDLLGNIVELVLEVDRLLVGATLELFVPTELLQTRGPVSTPELDDAGVILEVLEPDDFPGSWKNDYSRWPEATRPHPERPDIAITFRVLTTIGGGVSPYPLDDEGGPVWLGGALTARDGWLLEYWPNHPDLARVKTLRLQIHGPDRWGARGNS